MSRQESAVMRNESALWLLQMRLSFHHDVGSIGPQKRDSCVGVRNHECELSAAAVAVHDEVLGSPMPLPGKGPHTSKRESIRVK